jgi:hypothetical protein
LDVVPKNKVLSIATSASDLAQVDTAIQGEHRKTVRAMHRRQRVFGVGQSTPGIVASHTHLRAIDVHCD